VKIIAQNKKAFFDFEILEKFTAGISLLGCEIKSIRAGNVNLKGSFVSLFSGAPIWKNGHISPWKFATFQIDPIRERRLLLQKREISKIKKLTADRGISCVPISIGISPRGFAKLKIAVVRGKKKFDKRAVERRRELDREAERKIRKL